MKNICFAAVLAALTTAGFAQSAAKPAAHWQGTVKMPNRELPITLDLAQNSQGAWIGSISVTGSSSIDVPLNNVRVEDNAVSFAASLPMPANFNGRLSADGNALAGTASSAEGETTFQLARAGEATVKLPPASSKLSKEFEGTWEGTITSDGNSRRVAAKLTAAPDGTAIATLISVDKGMEFSVTTVTINGNALQLEARAISGKYHGTLGADGTITGEWTEGRGAIPLNLKRAPAR
jgi:hypothetical protein